MLGSSLTGAHLVKRNDQIVQRFNSFLPGLQTRILIRWFGTPRSRKWHHAMKAAEICVVGAGSSGIAVAKALAERELMFRLL